MNLGTEDDLETIWTSASPETLGRTVRLACKVAQAGAAVISSPRSTGAFVHCIADPAGVFTSTSREDGSDEEPKASLAVPLRLTSGRDIGVLRVLDPRPPDWPQDAEDLLGELAAGLTREIELALDLAREKATSGDLRLLEAVDRTPALIFERRKIDAGRSSYTFLGTRKAQLPGVRKMMEAGGGGGDLNFLHRDDRELVRTAILRSNLEETDLDLTFRVKDLDRSIRWLRSQSIVHRDPDGGVRWNGFVFDISDLVAAREEAEAARAEKDALLDSLGRELRAPAETIGGLAQALESEGQPGAVSTLAREIGFAAKALLAAVDRALTHSTEGSTERSDEHVARGPDESRSPASTEERSSTSAPGAGRILLADDLDLNRKLIADMLSLEGHVVDCVADGAQAVRAAREGRYDLILMDMVMPGMDGITATQAIRMLPAPVGRVPIVALTANSSPDQLDEAIKAGMDATLTKPMSVDALHTAVSTWIRRRYKAA